MANSEHILKTLELNFILRNLHLQNVRMNTLTHIDRNKSFLKASVLSEGFHVWWEELIMVPRSVQSLFNDWCKRAICNLYSLPWTGWGTNVLMFLTVTWIAVLPTFLCACVSSCRQRGEPHCIQDSGRHVDKGWSRFRQTRCLLVTVNVFEEQLFYTSIKCLAKKWDDVVLDVCVGRSAQFTASVALPFAASDTLKH